MKETYVPTTESLFAFLTSPYQPRATERNPRHADLRYSGGHRRAKEHYDGQWK